MLQSGTLHILTTQQILFSLKNNFYSYTISQLQYMLQYRWPYVWKFMLKTINSHNLNVSSLQAKQRVGRISGLGGLMFETFKVQQIWYNCSSGVYNIEKKICIFFLKRAQFLDPQKCKKCNFVTFQKNTKNFFSVLILCTVVLWGPY